MSLLPWQEPGAYALVLAAALAWDRWLGEPPGALHPVVWMGSVIGWCRRVAPTAPAPAFAWGLCVAIALPLAFSALGALVLLPWVGPLFAVWLLTSSFAIAGLGSAGRRLATSLRRQDLGQARADLSWLCSRDPSALDAAQLAAAATESVAENSSDSAVAPLLFFALGGVPGALLYRCVNTLDAMVGYRGAMEWLGKPSARLDDLLNLLPARLSAGLLLASGLLASGLLASGVSARRGWQVLRRDRSLTSSPNAGWPMAAMAGLLGVQLGKPGHYTLGAELPPCDAEALQRCCQLAEAGMTAWGLAWVATLGGAAMLPAPL